jgi:hypothetical protein
VSVSGYGSPVYYEITLMQPSTALFAVSYDGSFNASSPATNYLGDPGSSAASRTWEVMLPSGASTLTIVVHEVNVNAGLGQAYDLTVAGFADSNRTDLPSAPSGVPEPSSFALLGGARFCWPGAAEDKKTSGSALWGAAMT